MEMELTEKDLTNIVTENASFKQMEGFNNDVKAAVRNEKTSHVLDGEEQQLVNKIKENIRRIEYYMNNAGYVMPGNERAECISVIDSLKNGEISEIPSELLTKIEDRETALEEDLEEDLEI